MNQFHAVCAKDTKQCTDKNQKITVLLTVIMSAGFDSSIEANDIKYMLCHTTQATVVLHLIWMCTGTLKTQKATNLQNPHYPQHTCCMWQSQLCKRYWMLTHHTVCISRVDGIITEWAEIATPLTYHQPGRIRSRLDKAEQRAGRFSIYDINISQSIHLFERRNGTNSLLLSPSRKEMALDGAGFTQRQGGYIRPCAHPFISAFHLYKQ